VFAREQLRAITTDQFLRVTFKMTTDASGATLSPTAWAARIYQALKHGILIDGCMFHFLCYSASNLRSRKVWFLQQKAKGQNGITCDIVLRALGDFSMNASKIGKFAARIGQCFSKTTETVPIKAHSIKIVPDELVRFPDPVHGALYCSTDGCGEISVRTYYSTFLGFLP
jgi:hypothetical protein